MLDYAGNQSVLSTDELIELGIETNFLVTGSQADTTAPQLVSYELPSYSIDLSDPQISENNFVDSSSLSNEEWIIAEIIESGIKEITIQDNYIISKEDEGKNLEIIVSYQDETGFNEEIYLEPFPSL